VNVAAGRPSTSRARGRGELADLAALTGGVAYTTDATADVARAAQDIARQIRSGYAIAYTPANQVLDGSYRAVRVRVTGRGLTARTRLGYWASPVR
jgi:VWFA-related protein